MVQGLQLLLPVPAQGQPVLVNKLGEVSDGDVPFVEDVDSVDNLEILDALLELSDDLLVVGVQKVS